MAPSLYLVGSEEPRDDQQAEEHRQNAQAAVHCLASKSDRCAYDLDQPDGREAADHHPRWIELKPSHAELRRARMRMMIVVQALAARQPGEHAGV